MVVILPIGAAEEGGGGPRHRLDLLRAGGKVLGNLPGREAVEVGVGVGVAHHLVAGVREGLHRLGVFVHPLSHHEKGGLHAVFPQDVDKQLGVLVAPGGVKADGEHLVVLLHAVNGQLPGRRRRAHHRRVARQRQHHNGSRQAPRRCQQLFLQKNHFDCLDSLHFQSLRFPFQNDRFYAPGQIEMFFRQNMNLFSS